MQFPGVKAEVGAVACIDVVTGSTHLSTSSAVDQQLSLEGLDQAAALTQLLLQDAHLMMESVTTPSEKTRVIMVNLGCF